jgi:aspartate kinase
VTSDRIEIGGLIQRNHLAMIGIMDVPSRPGVGGKVLSVLGKQAINLELIVHLIDLEDRDHIVACVDRDDLNRALEVVEQIKSELGAKAITSEAEVAAVSIFGLDFREQHGIASQMCKTLGDCSINIRAISTSLSTITCVIEAQRLDDAVEALRETFRLP